MEKTTVNIIVPCYNEKGNIEKLVSEIHKAMDALSDKYDYCITFVNDGSNDGTLELLIKISDLDKRIKYLHFSKNFGHQLAVKAGIDYSKEDIVISMDADLQHPPEMLPELLQKWEEGFQIVNTLRVYPKEISKKKRLTSKGFYKILNYISEEKIIEGSADFRLIDAAVVNVIKTMDESEPFLRGIIPWVGFSQTYIPYQAHQRFSGQTKYTIKKMFTLAISGMTSFSVKPLYFGVYLGFLFSLLSLLYIPYVAYSFFVGSEISGWASLIMTVVFFGGLQLSILGIIGIYIGKVFKQTKNRPNYIIQHKNLQE